MAGRTRVSELAKELGVTSKEVLAKLSELGEHVKSASSRVEASVRRVRECFPNRPKPPQAPRLKAAPHPVDVSPLRRSVWERRNDPFDPLYSPPRYADHQRKFYKGDPPQGLTRFLLDELIVPGRPYDENPPRTAYWEDEVTRADKLVKLWAPTLLDGLTNSDILSWINSQQPVRPDDAVARRRAGVRSGDLGWSCEDRGRGTLAERFLNRRWTVDQVVNEVERRRSLRQAG